MSLFRLVFHVVVARVNKTLLNRSTAIWNIFVKWWMFPHTEHVRNTLGPGYPGGPGSPESPRSP